MSPKDGGPAFPAAAFEPEERGSMSWQDGMSLRDYFAAKASEEDIKEQADILRSRILSANRGLGNMPKNWRSIARYMHADTMLAARAKEDLR